MKNRIVLFLIIVMLLIVSLIWGFAYSRYLSQISGDGALPVAKWKIVVNDKDLSKIDSLGEIDLGEKTYTAETISSKKIAPGTEGAFSITLDATETEVGFDYKFEVNNVKNKPANMYFVVDGTEYATLDDVATAISGHIDANTENKKISKTIEWKWDYITETSKDGLRTTIDDNNNQDTLDGKNANKFNFNLKVTVTENSLEKQDNQKEEDFKNITYTNIAVSTEKNSDIQVASNTVTKGTSLYINIAANIDNNPCTITLKDDSSKTVPYEVTKNGKYTFIITGTYNNKTITEEKAVIVDQFIGLTAGVVKYDAGIWTESEIAALGNLYNENSSYSSDVKYSLTFGGFKVGSSRNESATNEDGTPTYSGWEILTSEEKDGKTYVKSIIHAGSPENFVLNPVNDNDGYKAEYILSSGARQTSYSTSNGSRNWDMYKDKSQLDLISNVHAMTYDEAYQITNSRNSSTNINRNIGTYYFLASACDDYFLWNVNSYGLMSMWDDIYYGCWGVRPVVTLKDNVYIASGTGTEADPYVLAIE